MQETDPRVPRNMVTTLPVTDSDRGDPRRLWGHRQLGSQEGFLEEGMPEPGPAEELQTEAKVCSLYSNLQGRVTSLTPWPPHPSNCTALFVFLEHTTSGL